MSCDEAAPSDCEWEKPNLWLIKIKGLWTPSRAVAITCNFHLASIRCNGYYETEEGLKVRFIDILRSKAIAIVNPNIAFASTHLSHAVKGRQTVFFCEAF